MSIGDMAFRGSMLTSVTILPSVPNYVKTQIRNELDGLFREGLDQPIQ